MTGGSGLIQWREWSSDAFASAAHERKPVLLAMGPAWCLGTDKMHRVSYGDPDVARVVSERFVPIRVDPDRRPDIGERYTLDGWPTTAFLTPAGALLGGGGHLDPARLLMVLTQVLDAFEARGEERVADGGLPGHTGERGDAPSVQPSSPLDTEEAGLWLDDQLRTRFDQVWAGFGAGAKRAHTAALKAALLRGRRVASASLADIVTRTLDAIADGGLVDAVEGGFFRYCEEPDWSRPHVEKLLTLNARMVDLLLTASRILDRPLYAERAAATIRFVHDRFADADGGFFASQRADPDYSALTSVEERGRHGEPPVDRSVYVDATATMASAYVLGAAVLEDRSLVEFAATAVDRVVMETYERGGGVGHALSGPPVRGLLGDHVSASAALLDLYDACGQAVYLDMPQELMAYCQQEMWDEGAGFRDRIRGGPDHPPPIGLLREPHRPFQLNCDAAVVLGRLATLTEEGHYHADAARVLASQASVYQARGLDGADYVLALEQLQALDTA